MGDLSKNFSMSEFACQCGNCDSVGDEMKPELIAKLQQLRDFYAQPLLINSAFRCQDHNAAVGSSVGSRHLTGEAVDIQCGFAGMRHHIVRLAMLLNFGGIGIANTFVHLDVRPLEDGKMWLY